MKAIVGILLSTYMIDALYQYFTVGGDHPNMIHWAIATIPMGIYCAWCAGRLRRIANSAICATQDGGGKDGGT